MSPNHVPIAAASEAQQGRGIIRLVRTQLEASCAFAQRLRDGRRMY